MKLVMMIMRETAMAYMTITVLSPTMCLNSGVTVSGWCGSGKPPAPSV